MSAFLMRLVALPALFCAALSAQTVSGTILGTIRDSQEAAVPNAKVTVTNVASNTSRNFTTDATGTYAIPIPTSRQGESEPLVTTPSPCSVRTGLSCRGMPGPVNANGASVSSGSRPRSASAPMKPVSSLQHHASPASDHLGGVALPRWMVLLASHRGQPGSGR